MSGLIEAIPAPVSGWVDFCATLAARSGAPMAADVGAARRTILEMSQGRCTFEIEDPSRFYGFRGAEARVGRMSLKFLSWDCESPCETVTWRNHDHHMALHIPLRGGFQARQGGIGSMCPRALRWSSRRRARPGVNGKAPAISSILWWTATRSTKASRVRPFRAPMAC